VILPDLTWRPPPPGLTLAGDEIHVWRASLDQPVNRIEQLRLTLSADECQRANRFHFERDRQRFVVGRGVLRSILGLYLGVDPGQVQFCYGAQGKPTLATQPGNANLGFNLAHSGPLVLYAFTRNRPIGVDVERVRPLSDADQMAARFFSAYENAIYRELPADEKQLALYLCWTRKEAYLKALGEGLMRPLEAFDVSLVPGEPARLLRVAWDPDEVSRWSLVSLEPLPGVVAALAVQGHGQQITCWDHSRLACVPGTADTQ
jgi:4'-phosphopantetheinyl transferase